MLYSYEEYGLVASLNFYTRMSDSVEDLVSRFVSDERPWFLLMVVDEAADGIFQFFMGG